MPTHEEIALAAFYLYEQRMQGDNRNFGYDKAKADAGRYKAQAALMQRATQRVTVIR